MPELLPLPSAPVATSKSELPTLADEGLADKDVTVGQGGVVAGASFAGGASLTAGTSVRAIGRRLGQIKASIVGVVLFAVTPNRALPTHSTGFGPCVVPLTEIVYPVPTGNPLTPNCAVSPFAPSTGPVRGADRSEGWVIVQVRPLTATLRSSRSWSPTEPDFSTGLDPVSFDLFEQPMVAAAIASPKRSPFPNSEFVSMGLCLSRA